MAMNKRIAQGDATRRQLLDVATQLFAEQGYDLTSIEQVLGEAGVSRGSLYHHYDSKEQLFEAVVEQLEQGVVEQLMGVEAVAEAGRLAVGDVDVVAHVLLGALNEAAMLVARAETPVAARRQATKAVDRLIDGFLRSS